MITEAVKIFLVKSTLAQYVEGSNICVFQYSDLIYFIHTSDTKFIFSTNELVLKSYLVALINKD